MFYLSIDIQSVGPSVYMLHQCYTSVSPVFHQCSVSPVFHQCLTSVSLVFQKCFKSALRIIPKCLSVLSVLKLFVRIEVIAATRALGGLVLL